MLKKIVLGLVFVLSSCVGIQENALDSDAIVTNDQIAQADYSHYEVNESLELEYPSNWERTEVETLNSTLDIVKLKQPLSSSQIIINTIDCSYASEARDIAERLDNSFRMQYEEGSGEFWAPDSGKLYIHTICGAEVEFFEYESLPLPGGDYSENFVVITQSFTSGNFSVSISLCMDSNEPDIHQELRDQYWQLIDSIECPVVDD